jgi:hypothetical protein
MFARYPITQKSSCAPAWTTSSMRPRSSARTARRRSWLRTSAPRAGILRRGRRFYTANMTFENARPRGERRLRPAALRARGAIYARARSRSFAHATSGRAAGRANAFHRAQLLGPSFATYSSRILYVDPGCGGRREYARHGSGADPHPARRRQARSPASATQTSPVRTVPAQPPRRCPTGSTQRRPRVRTHGRLEERAQVLPRSGFAPTTSPRLRGRSPSIATFKNA